jgi:hypothetical protein
MPVFPCMWVVVGMRKRNLLVVLLSLLIAGWLVAANVGSPTSGSQTLDIRPANRVLDLGEGDPLQVLVKIITLDNLGSSPIDFRIVASCGCTSVEPRLGTLAPGESKEVAIKVTLPDSSGSAKSTSLAVLYGPNEEFSAKIGLVGRSRKYLEATPASIDFGRVELASRGEYRDLYIKSVQSSHIGPVRLHSQPGYVDVRPLDTSDNSVYAYRISLSAPYPQQDFYDSLTFEGKAGIRLVVPIRGRVGRSCTIVPAIAVVRPNASGDRKSRLRFFIDSHDTPISADSVHLSPSISGVRLLSVNQVKPHRVRADLLVHHSEMSSDLQLEFTIGSEVKASARLVISSE